MLSWALTFLIIAIIAGVLGFGGIASASVSIAQILFFVFLVAGPQRQSPLHGTFLTFSRFTGEWVVSRATGREGQDLC